MSLKPTKEENEVVSQAWYGILFLLRLTICRQQVISLRNIIPTQTYETMDLFHWGIIDNYVSIGIINLVTISDSDNI